MKFFKKLFNKKSKLSMCDNVTQQTRTSDHMKMENVTKLIDLVQEPGIVKEIFEMQQEKITVHMIYGQLQYGSTLLGYSKMGHDYASVRHKLEMYLYTKLYEYRLDQDLDIKIFNEPNFDFFDFFTNLDDSICETRKFFIKKNTKIIFTCFHTREVILNKPDYLSKLPYPS